MRSMEKRQKSRSISAVRSRAYRAQLLHELKTHRYSTRMRALLQRFLSSLLASFLVTSLVVCAQSPQTQSPAAVQRAVEDFVRAQTSSYTNRATFTVGNVDARLALPACSAMEVFVPSGGRLWGNSSVGVRCGAPTPWTLYVSVTVRVSGSYVAASRSLAAGQRSVRQTCRLSKATSRSFPRL